MQGLVATEIRLDPVVLDEDARIRYGELTAMLERLPSPKPSVRTRCHI